MNDLPVVRSPWRILILVLGFTFLYAPMLMLVIYSFNSSKLVTVWAGWSTRWYSELFHDDAMMSAVGLSLTIAALAATEVEGVASMAGNITNELVGKLGMKNLSKGVKVDVLEGIVTVSLALNLKYNYSIVEVSARVQEKVKNAIENMTGLEVADVNIKVAGVEMESQE